MKRASMLSLVVAILLVPLLGCGDEKAAAAQKLDPRHVDPSKYYGTYTGQAMEGAPSTGAQAESTLSLTQNDSTYTLTYMGVKVFGNYAYLSGEMELYAYSVDGHMKRQVQTLTPDPASGLDAEKIKLYKAIQAHKWRFTVLPDGFRMNDAEGLPARYEYHKTRATAGRGGGGGGAADMSIDGVGTPGQNSQTRGTSSGVDPSALPKGDYPHGVMGMGK